MNVMNNNLKFIEPPNLDYVVMESLSDKIMPEDHPGRKCLPFKSICKIVWTLQGVVIMFNLFYFRHPINDLHCNICNPYQSL